MVTYSVPNIHVFAPIFDSMVFSRKHSKLSESGRWAIDQRSEKPGAEPPSSLPLRDRGTADKTVRRLRRLHRKLFNTLLQILGAAPDQVVTQGICACDSMHCVTSVNPPATKFFHASVSAGIAVSGCDKFLR
ncbi:hypothetical protein RRG08_064973 [Elysia crispata]|uniref:Uncharacterized protein n=1 Tax=Elysia crispata TaxID=231223 RepID=A0AAE1CVI3_9GAST|nr:hypothetical protein RRG08_064973 [Elysia crispata]